MCKNVKKRKKDDRKRNYYNAKLYCRWFGAIKKCLSGIFYNI